MKSELPTPPSGAVHWFIFLCVTAARDQEYPVFALAQTWYEARAILRIKVPSLNGHPKEAAAVDAIKLQDPPTTGRYVVQSRTETTRYIDGKKEVP